MTDPLEKELELLKDGLRNVKEELQYLIVRERVHRNSLQRVWFHLISAAESTNSRVAWWSIFESGALVAVCALQIFFIQQFFEVKRSIWINTKIPSSLLDIRSKQREMCNYGPNTGVPKASIWQKNLLLKMMRINVDTLSWNYHSGYHPSHVILQWAMSHEACWWPYDARPWTPPPEHKSPLPRRTLFQVRERNEAHGFGSSYNERPPNGSKRVWANSEIETFLKAPMDDRSFSSTTKESEGKCLAPGIWPPTKSSSRTSMIKKSFLHSQNVFMAPFGFQPFAELIYRDCTHC